MRINVTYNFKEIFSLSIFSYFHVKTYPVSRPTGLHSITPTKCTKVPQGAYWQVTAVVTAVVMTVTVHLLVGDMQL